VSDGNGFDGGRIAGYVKKIQGELRTLDTYAAEHRNRCKGPRSSIKAITDEAKDAGIPSKMLSALVKRAEFERKAARVGDVFDDEDRETFDQMVESFEAAVGEFADTPLGQAARPKRAERAEAAINSLTDDEDDEFERVGRENGVRLAAGIKPLN
jgi:hypothetical protein